MKSKQSTKARIKVQNYFEISDKGYMSITHCFQKYILNAGINLADSAAKVRAIRISNLTCLTAVMNCLIFGLFFKFLGDTLFFNACMIAGVIYSLAHMISYFGFTNTGRFLLLISGNLVIFYFASAFKGEANFQFFFFSLSTAAFVHFSWEERKYFFLIILPVFLLLLGDFYSWDFFSVPHQTYNLQYLRLISTIAPLFQIALGFFYFLKQSVKFEAESNENLKKLEIEYSKQIQVQKMSSLGEMAGGIAHEINNPLMVIIGTTYQIKKELEKALPPNHPVFSRMEKIDSMVQRIVRIIQALRNFSRNSEHDMSELIELQTIINSTLDLCQERFVTNGIKLEISGDKNLKILCRPTEISQVLLNLLNNAFDATNLREGAKVSINTRVIDGKVEITVEDNGHGIDPHIVDKIMQPFFSTKDIGKGTGLGLSISKGLIEGHKGTLAFIPGVGKTTFQITLPLLA